MDLVRVFQAAPLLGLLRMLVRGLSIAARPVAKNGSRFTILYKT
jgi:hypothetical protein